jgi:hypothetical protein
MWKLLKAELSYYKLPLAIVFLYVIASKCAYLVKCLLFTYYNYGAKLNSRDWSWFIGINCIFLILVFISLIIEFKENRLRQISQLPLPISMVGYSRLLPPLLICILFYIIYLLFSVLTIFTDSYYGNIILLTLNFKLVIYFWITIGIAYLIRLFSEWQGRIIFFVGIFLLTIYFNLTNNYLYAHDFNNFVNGLYSINYIKFLIDLIPVIFAGLIQWFFMIRRSYLQ